MHVGALTPSVRCADTSPEDGGGEELYGVVMRAEAQAMVKEIEESLELLRRRL